MATTARASASKIDGKYIGAVAIGAGLGLAAALGRKVVVQAASGVSGDWDQVLATEHKMVAGIFALIEKTTESDVAKRTALLTTLKHALGKHSFAEENVVYPAIRDAVGDESAEHLNHDHGLIKDHLYDLTNLSRSDPQWIVTARSLKSLIEEHVREEEDELFPQMKGALSDAENKALTLAVNKEGFKLA